MLYFPSTEEKIPLLMGLLRRIDARRTMVFVNTRRIAEVLERTLTANGFVAQALSGDVPQTKRLKMMRDFHNGDVAVLIATDVASRGLHIPDVSHVFNFDLPNDAEDYVHRIGRTARAGAEGDAISFGCEEYAISLPDIERYIGHQIPRAAIDRRRSGRRHRAAARGVARTRTAARPIAGRRPRRGRRAPAARIAPGGRSGGGPRRAPAAVHGPRMPRRRAPARGSGDNASTGERRQPCRVGRRRGGGGGAIAAATDPPAVRPLSHEIGHPIDRRIAARILRGPPRIRQPHRAQPRDAEAVRGIEHRNAVIHEQRALREKLLLGQQPRPEGGIFLRRVERVGRIARIEMQP